MRTLRIASMLAFAAQVACSTASGPAVTPTAAPPTPAPTSTDIPASPTPFSTPTPLPMIGPDDFEDLLWGDNLFLKIDAALFNTGVVLQSELQDRVCDEFGECTGGLQNAYSDLAYSPDGRYFAAAGCALGDTDGSCGDRSTQNGGGPFAFIMEPENGSFITSIPGIPDYTTVDELAFTHDGARLIYAARPGSLSVWDVAAGAIEAEITQIVEGSHVRELSISPDDRWVAYTTVDDLDASAGALKVWNLESGELALETSIRLLKSRLWVGETSARGWGLPQFSRDSRRMLIVTDEALLLYDTATWSEISHHRNPCTRHCNLAASPDLSVLLVVEAESDHLPPTSATVWDLTTGEQIRDITDGLVDEPTLMVFTPNGRLLFGVTHWTVFDTEEWRLISEYSPLGSLIRYCEFADDGRSLLYWGEAGLYRLHLS